MSHTSMMKKRGREGMFCNNRHCVSPSDASMSWFQRGGQRARERREWRANVRAETTS